MALIQTEDTRFARDTQSMALLNTDTAALQQHRTTRRKSQQQGQLAEDVRALQTQVETLTSLVQQLLTTFRS